MTDRDDEEWTLERVLEEHREAVDAMARDEDHPAHGVAKAFLKGGLKHGYIEGSELVERPRD